MDAVLKPITIAATPQSVKWGFFDASTPPVVAVPSGSVSLGILQLSAVGVSNVWVAVLVEGESRVLADTRRAIHGLIVPA